MKKLPRYLNQQIFLSTLICTAMIFSNIVTASDEINLAHKQVLDAAEKFVFDKLHHENDENLQVKASPLDHRINIPLCSEPFQISASPEALTQSNITVRASCPSNNWYLFMMVKATQIQPVVVLSSAVSPGSLLTRQNVKIVKMDKKRIRSSTFADIESVLGARIKRRIRPGQPLIPKQVCFVCKGDNILITAKTQGLSIKTSGIAQQDGNVGDTIAVRNNHSKKLVNAQVLSANNVVVSI